MSDRNSESSQSSFEWILLDDVPQEVHANNLSLELNFDSVSPVASESLRSSLSGEELEWQYDSPMQFNDLSPYDFSYVEDIDPVNADSRVVENDTAASDYDSSSYLYDDIDLNLASIKKVHCYKHKRNDHLNFILNLMLAVVVSSAIGFGSGHFLGWSHKCWTDSKSTDEVPQHPILDVVAMRQTVESLVPVVNGILDSPNLWGNLKHQPPFQKGGQPSSQDDSKETLSAVTVNNNKTKDSSIQAVSKNVDVSNIHDEKNTSNNSTDSDHISVNYISNIDWGDIHEITVPIGKRNPTIQDLDLDDKYVTSDIEHSEVQGKLLNSEAKFFEKLYSGDKKTTKVNVTSQLQNDLIQVIQTLNIFAISQFTNSQENFFLSDFKEINQFYTDLQNIIISKMTFIENFVQTEEYKKYPKYGIKHLRKMVYSLIDPLDNVVKRSLKMLNKYKKINANKFAKNMSKIILNFDQKWLRHQNAWSQNLEMLKMQEQKQNTFYDSKRKIYKANKEKPHKKENEQSKKGFSESHFKQKQNKHHKNS